MDFLNYLGRKFFMGLIVFGVMTAVFLARPDALNFGRYADFGEMAFAIFVLGNGAEWFFKSLAARKAEPK